MEVDLSNLDAKTRLRVDEIIRGDFDLKALKAIKEQTRTAKALRDRPPQWRDDFGPQAHAINPFFDWMWSTLYGHDYKQNPDVMKFLGRRNPEITVQGRSGKTMVGYKGGSRVEGRGSRDKRGCRFGRGTLELAK